MKKTLIFLLLSFWCVFTFAKTADVPNPMLADGREWVYKNHHFEEGSVIPQIIEGNNTLTQYDYSEVVSYTYYTLRGDTLIDGKRYYKTFRRNGDGDENYDRAMREEGRIVYQVMRGMKVKESFLTIGQKSCGGTWSSLMSLRL